MRHVPPPPEKNGRGPTWAHSTKTTLTPTLSLPLHPGLGGGEKRERESNREKENPHTHTLAHTSVPVKPEWRENKEAGR